MCWFSLIWYVNCHWKDSLLNVPSFPGRRAGRGRRGGRFIEVPIHSWWNIRTLAPFNALLSIRTIVSNSTLHDFSLTNTIISAIAVLVLAARKTQSFNGTSPASLRYYRNTCRASQLEMSSKRCPTATITALFSVSGRVQGAWTLSYATVTE